MNASPKMAANDSMLTSTAKLSEAGDEESPCKAADDPAVNEDSTSNDNDNDIDNEGGPVDRPQRKSNDLIFDEGFPVLNSFVLPSRHSTTTKPTPTKPHKTLYDPTIIPRYPFASFPSPLTISPHQLPSVLQDFEQAFDARTKEDDAAYSTGATFFMPAGMKPRCALEDLALRIFRSHTEGLMVGRDYDLERSGAEWWTLVLDSSEKEDCGDGGDDDDDGGGKHIARSVPMSAKQEGKIVQKDNKHSSAGCGGVAATATAAATDDDNDGDEDEDDEDDEVGMHFDADYGLEEQLPNLMLHPRVATVTYLSDVGVPTLVLNRRSPPPADVQKKSLNGPIDSGWLSFPTVGKHIAFDGRLLHGGPGEFFPAGPPSRGIRHADDDDDVSEGRSTKRRRLDNETSIASAAEKVLEPIPLRETKRRFTFMVNVWLNHCPIDAELIDDDLIAGMKTVWKEDDGVVALDTPVATKTSIITKEKKEKGALIGAASSNGNNNRKRGSATKATNGYTPPFRWSLPNATEPNKKLPKQEITGTEDESKWAGTETPVICNREVAMQFRSTMEDYHQASRSAFDVDGKSIELSFSGGAIYLEVGDEVEDSSDEEE